MTIVLPLHRPFKQDVFGGNYITLGDIMYPCSLADAVHFCSNMHGSAFSRSLMSRASRLKERVEEVYFRGLLVWLCLECFDSFGQQT